MRSQTKRFLLANWCAKTTLETKSSIFCTMSPYKLICKALTPFVSILSPQTFKPTRSTDRLHPISLINAQKRWQGWTPIS